MRNCTELGKILLDESGILSFGIQKQLKESGILLTIGIKRESFPVVGIQNPSYTDKDWNSVRRIRNPRLGIQVPKLSWIVLLGTKENQWAGGVRERL